MALKCSRMFKHCFILLLVVLLHQAESKPKGGRRTGGGGSKYSGTSHTQHTSNTGGSHYTGGNSGHHDTVHQSHTYNTGNSHPIVPSAPVASGGNSHSIGFEHFNNNNQHGGSQNTHRDIGFENAQHRVPQQNSHPTPHPIGFNVPVHNTHTGHRNGSSGGGSHNTYYPGNSGTYNNNNHHGMSNHSSHVNRSNIPLNAGYPPQGGAQNNYYPGNSGYQPQGGTQNNYYPGNSGIYNQPHGQYPQYPHITQNPPGGYYNPNLAQPGSYYHQYQGVPNGPPPQIYQPYPVKQSSGGSVLGYAGSLAGGLAGGYLIGRLTSGGGGQSSNENYVVHHYHHNSDAVPKQLSVSNNSVATCSQNDTQGLCVPNTFPICLYNGTIMCVTHTLYTTPCTGLNTSSACVVTVLPCASGDLKCNNTSNSTTAVFVPCISNVTLADPSNLSVVMPASNATSGQSLNGNRVELCVTAIAEPKYRPPPIGNPPQVLAPAQDYSANNNKLTKSEGSHQSFTSGWAYVLIFMLWVGIK